MGICNAEEAKPKERRRVPPNYFITDNFCKYHSIDHDYIFEDSIGEGAYGKVSIARNKMGNKFAIKQIFKSSIKVKESIKNEAKINMSVSHPNIAKCYSIYEDESSIYFVMDLIEGGTLLDFMKNSPEGHLDEEDSLDLLIQILTTLDYLHNQKSIVHRDIKPENFLIVIENDIPKIKLIDFGFACFIPRENYMHEILGTRSYMAPEMIEEGTYTKMADLWSTGVLFYNLLTGYSPFSCEEDQLEDEIVNGYIDFDIILNSELRKLCQGLLDKLPDCRLNAKNALKKALEIKSSLENILEKENDEKEIDGSNNKTIFTKLTTPSSKKTSAI